MSPAYVRTVKKDDGRVYHCRQCDGDGWLTTGRFADTAGGSGFHPDVYIPERIRCPARCDAGILVRTTDVGARSGGEVPR